MVAVEKYRLDEKLWRFIAQNIRNPEEVRGDMEAQIAANGVGAKRIGELIERRGAESVRRDFEAVQDYAERLMRSAISGVPDGTYSYSDVLEGDGISNRHYRIEVTATVHGSEIDFDFSRSDKAARGPINCGVASVAACVYYVAKALAGADIPANAGAFRPFHVNVRPGTILSPKFPAAVCNANIVTTQRIVDVILGALAQAFPDRVGAASSGSMHLINIGVQHRDRYLTLVETFAGGQGGLPGQDGMHAVHSHMTNTRNTPGRDPRERVPDHRRGVLARRGLGRGRPLARRSRDSPPLPPQRPRRRDAVERSGVGSPVGPATEARQGALQTTTASARGGRRIRLGSKVELPHGGGRASRHRDSRRRRLRRSGLARRGGGGGGHPQRRDQRFRPLRARASGENGNERS